MKKLFYLLVIFLGHFVMAQDEITKPIGEFHEIKVFDAISVNLVKSDEYKVIISGEDKEKVVVVNNGDKLKIRMDINKIFEGKKTYVQVFYKGHLNLIDVNENGFIGSSDVIEEVDLDIRGQEGGEVDLKIKTDRLKVRSVSGATIELNGSAKIQDIEVNTGGIYKGRDLQTDQTSVSVNAGGNAEIFATDYAEAKVKAGGTIRVFGNPKVLDETKFIGGNIIKE
ncbi:head GIN domain-containing protein [Robertkochia solimangrovi]|uniref:head GIN domain-containing protein n=1 Tax=Robertkochia solimangrovi TaxID=2213046 RepID=UPI00117D054D|nr:head GIN domain-containing protein [Robertkochia solimangrovi]TRZ46066.1 DUF2807 domain-containing protein [Robertkochia solimangrovi]